MLLKGGAQVDLSDHVRNIILHNIQPGVLAHTRDIAFYGHTHVGVHVDTA